MISRLMRFTIRFLLVLILLSCMLPLHSKAMELEPASDREASSQQSSEMTPQQQACERAANTEWWYFSYNSSYSASDTGDYASYKTSQSVTGSFTLGMPERTSTKVTWSILQSDGNGKIDDEDRDKDNQSWAITKGDGKALTGGWLYLDRTTCSYSLELSAGIPATISQPDSVETSPHVLVAEFRAYKRPIELDADGELLLQGSSNSQASDLAKPRLAWSGKIPALTQQPNSQTDIFVPNGYAASSILNLRANRGQQTAGEATVSWNGKRMGISSLSFQQQQVPSKNWADLPAEGTVDGNKVRIIAKIDNPSHNTIPGPVRFIDAETNELLPKGEIAFSLAASTSGEVVYEWDTQGWAWNKGRAQGAHSDRKIRVEIGPEDEIYDSAEREVKVRPKPVVLVHGLNSNAGTWASYPAMLKSVNKAWNAYPISTMRTGNDPAAQEASNPISSNAFELAKYIEEVRAKEQAWHIDLVAHSMGGLISRQYIHSLMQAAPSVDDRPLARNLVMLGTPNQGSLCAIALTAVNTFSGSKNLHAPTELMPKVVANFNQQVTQQRGVHFSVIAGNTYPFPCHVSVIPQVIASDWIVTVKSAHHTYSDIGFTSQHHIGMTGDQDIFNSWVLPRLALGAGTNPALVAAQSSLEASTSQAEPEESSPQFSVIASQTVTAKASLDLPISLSDTKAFGVMLVAPASISASLIDPSGKVVDTIAAGSERALQPFLMLKTDMGQVGEWKLRLQNSSQNSATIQYGVMLAEPNLVSSAWFERDAQATGGLLLQKLSNKGTSVKASKVSAKIVQSDGTSKSIELFDNGQNGDAVAGDGIFSAQVADAISASVSAELNGEVRISVAEEQAPSTQSTFSVLLPVVRR